MKDIKETTEFFTPKLGLTVAPYIAAASKQGIHHVGRYQWACEVLRLRRPARVLDIACGAGYGSYMLAEALPDAQIVGGDYDPRAIEYATANYSAANLSYTTADMVTWEFGNLANTKGFDAIVSFDTIEHLLHREIALIRMCENLTSAGALLLSTPCGRPQNKLNPGWEHHKIEYSYVDLYKLLSRFFEQVIYPQHPEFTGKEVWEEINRGMLRYLNRMNPLICVRPIGANIEPPAESKFAPAPDTPVMNAKLNPAV